MVCLYRGINLIFRKVNDNARPYLSVPRRHDNMIPNYHSVRVLPRALLGTPRLCRLITRRVQVKDRTASCFVGNVDHRLIPVLPIRIRCFRQWSVAPNGNEDRLRVLFHETIRVVNVIPPCFSVG